MQTEALGLSAEEVEQLITLSLEQDLLNGVAFLDNIRSESLPGLSRIVITFEPGTDPARARQVVSERLLGAATGIPTVGGLPQMLQPLSSDSRVMLIRLSSKTAFADRPLGARALDHPARAAQRPRRRQRLRLGRSATAAAPGAGRPGASSTQQGVTLDQVIRTTGNSLWASPLTFLEASTPGTGGFFETPSQRLGVQHVQPIKTAEELAEVVLEKPDGAAGRARGSDSVTSRPSSRTTSRSSATRCSRTGRACSSWSRSCPRPTPSR